MPSTPARSFPAAIALALVLAAPAGAWGAQEQPSTGQDAKVGETTKPRVEERLMVVGSAENLELIPGSATTIDGAALVRAQSAFGDIHRILRALPGVNIQEEDGFGLRPNIGLRGSGSERSARITLMEDGVLIAPAPYAAPAAYYFPTAGRMEAVEVRKGSSQIKFGPRTNGGALNLVSTRVPDAFALRAELAGGGHATGKGRLSLGNGAGAWGWLLETYQLRSAGFKQVDGGGDAGFRLGDYLGKLRFRPAAHDNVLHQLEAKLGYSEQRANETYLGLTEADFVANPIRRYAGSQLDRIDSEHRQVQAGYFGVLGPALDLTVVAYRNDFKRDWYKLQSVLGAGLSSVLDDPDRYPQELAILQGADSGPDSLRQRHNDREYYGQGVQAVLGVRHRSGPFRQQLEVGARYHVDQEDRFQSEDGYRMLDGKKLLTSVGAPGSQSNRVSQARAWALYAQDRIDIGRVGITPGLRFESISTSRTDYTSTDPARLRPTSLRRSRTEVLLPGLGLDYRLASRHSVFLGAHRGFAPPGPGAADAVLPETSVNYELGYRHRAARSAAGLTAFFNDYENLLGSDTLAAGGQGTGDQFNGGVARVWGAEVSASHEFARSGSELTIPIAIAYTWTRGQFRSSFESEYEPWGSVQAGDRLPYLAEHQLNVSAGLQATTWDLFASVTVASAMRTVAGQGPIAVGSGTDASTVVDLSAGHEVARSVRVSLALKNALDAVYNVARRPAGLRPGLPRTLVLGLAYSR